MRQAPAEEFDVVICGGGLAGLLLARQLRREFPDDSVAVVERTARPLDDACHKVGESSVEVASQYFESLGLESYLLDRHLVKLGLRFFPGGGRLPVEERTEIGPCAEPIVRSYQLDRGRLEEDLRAFVEADGVRMLEGTRVRAIRLAEEGAPHEVTIAKDGAERTLLARWVVDATGRAALLRKQLKLTRGSRHAANAGWFRVEGKLDINDLVPASATEWHERPCRDDRWRSTNHFMGTGYWAWVIPLSTGHTSIGLVVHDEEHGFEVVRSLDAVRAFLDEHEPVLARAVRRHRVKDFLCLKGYSHAVSRAWSKDRWAIVGEAGAFVDPLYSPGSDFIAFANSFTVEMMRADRDGRDLVERASLLNAQYKSLCAGATDIFRRAAPVYGHGRAMSAKVYWDNFSYWSFTAQYLRQEIYRLPSSEHAPYGVVGRRFVELSHRMQALFRAWAEVRPEETPERKFMALPAFPSVLVDTHVALRERWTPEETLASMQRRVAEAEEIAVEMVVRVIQEVGPDDARAILDRVEFERWGLAIPPERLDAERLRGLTRRHRLSPIARDVERSLGHPIRHERGPEALDLLAQGSAA
ncbi:MAG: NAD(P)/FAD-dependent oxidoreductase [Planctomycetota bacterium JB042]